MTVKSYDFQSYICVVSNKCAIALNAEGEFCKWDFEQYGPTVDEFGAKPLPEENGVYIWQGEIRADDGKNYGMEDSDADVFYNGKYTRLTDVESAIGFDLTSRGIVDYWRAEKVSL